MTDADGDDSDADGASSGGSSAESEDERAEEGGDAEAGGRGQQQQGGVRPLQTFVFSATLTLPPALRKRLRKGGCCWANPGMRKRKDPIAVCGCKSTSCGLSDVTVTPACWGLRWGLGCLGPSQSFAHEVSAHDPQAVAAPAAAAAAWTASWRRSLLAGVPRSADSSANDAHYLKEAHDRSWTWACRLVPWSDDPDPELVCPNLAEIKQQHWSATALHKDQARLFQRAS